MRDDGTGNGTLACLLGRDLRGIYASIFLLGLAIGAESSVLALFLRSASLSSEKIGSLATAYAAGGVAISALLGRVVGRVGAIRTLAVALVALGLAIAVLPVAAHSTTGLYAGRVVEGAALVAVWVGYEAALFSRAKPAHRATVSTLYAMVLALGYVIGPLVARALFPFGVAALPFWFAAAVTIGNGLSITAFSRERGGASMAPAADEPSADASFASLAWKVKTTGFGMFAAGYLKASLILFLPLYLVDHRGLLTEEPPLVLSAYAAGSLLFTHFAGRLGDRHGHLVLMGMLSAIGGLALFGVLFVDAVTAMCLISAVAGATLGAISPLGMALQASIAKRTEYGRAMSLSNGLYAAGTLAGPFVTGVLYAQAPRMAMIQVAAMWLVFTAFCIVFAADDPARHPMKDA
ncbi:putative multi-drug efflux transporter [Labilithrix luteola]|uniref:Putative multi-drug efflux transporter n=1 Tax=Labilithrix luteola TaxID=1391654 RepID=A0A0K1Q3T2_9BACT|nr:MFS transporter [Labilithrix luteola]AKV00389.1 putative multi-drug efflux transporter [Labilithrix luteola]